MRRPRTSIQIPLLYHGDPPVRPEKVAYDLVPATARQRLYDGRLELRPELDHRQYEITALVDWIEISFDTPFSRRWNDVRAFARGRLKRSGNVSVVEPDAVGEAFSIRIQEPFPADVFQLCRDLEATYDIRSDEARAIRISGIEVSVDFYPCSRRDDDRQLMTETIRRHLVPDAVFFEEARRRPRSFDPKRPKEPRYLLLQPDDRHKTLAAHHNATAESRGRPPLTPDHFRDLTRRSYRQPWVDTMFYVGDRCEVVSLNVQDKITHEVNPARGTHRRLDARERRTRVEVRLLRGMLADLGMAFPGNLVEAPFSRLAKIFFRMGIPTIAMSGGEPDADELQIFERGGLMGLDRYQRARHLDDEITALADRRSGAKVRPLGPEGYWLAWSERQEDHDRGLNPRIRIALEHLDARWQA